MEEGLSCPFWIFILSESQGGNNAILEWINLWLRKGRERRRSERKQAERGLWDWTVGRKWGWGGLNRWGGGVMPYIGKAREGETGIWDGWETEAGQRRSGNNTIRGGKEWGTVRVEWGRRAYMDIKADWRDEEGWWEKWKKMEVWKECGNDRDGEAVDSIADNRGIIGLWTCPAV